MNGKVMAMQQLWDYFCPWSIETNWRRGASRLHALECHSCLPVIFLKVSKYLIYQAIFRMFFSILTWNKQHIIGTMYCIVSCMTAHCSKIFCASFPQQSVLKCDAKAIPASIVSCYFAEAKFINITESSFLPILSVSRFLNFNMINWNGFLVSAKLILSSF